jgi:hypothetical protein
VDSRSLVYVERSLSVRNSFRCFRAYGTTRKFTALRVVRIFIKSSFYWIRYAFDGDELPSLTIPNSQTCSIPVADDHEVRRISYVFEAILLLLVSLRAVD